MYKPPQNRSQSAIPATSSKSSKGQNTPGSFKVQTQKIDNTQLQLEPQKYSSELADLLAAKMTSTTKQARPQGETGELGVVQMRPTVLDEQIQRKVQAQLIQRASDRSFQAGGNIESQLNNGKDAGSSLSEPIRAYIEPRFRADFSPVQVHTGEQVVQMNRELGAQTFTHGNNIYFGTGKSSGVNELTAHELSHVVQQTGSVMYPKLDTPIIQASSVQMRVIQRQENTSENNTTASPGRGISTDFGNYWIIPDDTKISYNNVQGEPITESEFTELQKTWDTLKSGSGKLEIRERDRNGKEYNGFKDKMLAQFGKLLSKPSGRKLVMQLVKGPLSVLVRPSAKRVIGRALGGFGSLENADGTPGVGGATTVEIDADLQDTDILVYDSDGKEISFPVFIILGHELIHARHNATGQSRIQFQANDRNYSNSEEERTIAKGSLTENDLRSEHGLPHRYGHQGRDTRPRILRN